MRPRSIRPLCLLVALLLLPILMPAQEDWGGQTIGRVVIRMQHAPDERLIARLNPLLAVREGEAYQYRTVRQSIENLYLSGVLKNVSVHVTALAARTIQLDFVCESRLTVGAVVIHKNDALLSGEVRAALFSLRRHSFLEQRILDEAGQQLRNLYEGEGYLNPQVEFQVKPARRRRIGNIHVHIRAGVRTRVGRLQLVCERPDLQQRLRRAIKPVYYRPRQIDQELEKIRQYLRKRFYFFPEISVSPQFTGIERKLADLRIVVKPGPQYRFSFIGMSDRLGLIKSVWTTRVSERWAESESCKRLLLYLKNKGYHDARLESRLDLTPSGDKQIRFTVEKGKRYRLGEVRFSGVPEAELPEVKNLLSVFDNWFNRILWLQANPVLVDQEMVRLYFYQKGYANARVVVETSFDGDHADLLFKVTPGERSTIKAVSFLGNEHFGADILLEKTQLRIGEPFVQHRFSEDMERLRQFYIAMGYAKVRIEPRLSSGVDKEIEVRVGEGPAYRLGELIVIGVSSMQESWLRRMFPLKPGQAYDITKVSRFLEEVEQMGAFSRILLNTIETEPGCYNALLTISADKSRFYGFGIGWEERKGVSGIFESLRGTVEFQGRNIFSSYSSLSGILQAGLNETRLVISLDTPNLLSTDLNSSFKLWREKETFTSYTFDRIGIGPTLVKRTGVSSFISASLNWYRTELTDLKITPTPSDTLHDPFDTLAFNFSFVSDRRDDPFNPSQGDFFSADLKVGMPFFREHDSFFRFMWRFQKNLKLAKILSLAFSLRNGFAAGDMSITERFFAGGINSFHGTRLDKLGPKDAQTGLPTGGNGLFLFNTEATFPLVFLPSKEWYGSVFIDIGNVYSRAGNINLSKVERALGFGLKYRTPLGPVRLDFSWNLRKKADYDFIFHFGIGNAF